MVTIFLLDAAGASWGLYQLIFVCAVLLSLYSAYTWYEGRRDKEPPIAKKGRLLFLLAVVLMIITSVVSYAIAGKLPF